MRAATVPGYDISADILEEERSRELDTPYDQMILDAYEPTRCTKAAAAMAAAARGEPKPAPAQVVEQAGIGKLCNLGKLPPGPSSSKALAKTGASSSSGLTGRRPSATPPGRCATGELATSTPGAGASGLRWPEVPASVRALSAAVEATPVRKEFALSPTQPVPEVDVEGRLG